MPQETEPDVIARELYNEALQLNRLNSFINNLARKKAKGTYDHEKALKLWTYLIDDLARTMQKEYGDKVDRDSRNDAVELIANDPEIIEKIDAAARAMKRH